MTTPTPTPRPDCACCGAPADGRTGATDASPAMFRCVACAQATCGDWTPLDQTPTPPVDPYVTDAGADVMAGVLPLDHSASGLPFVTVRGIGADDVAWLVSWAAGRGQGMHLIGDDDDVMAWGMHAVMVGVDGVLLAAVSTVGGGPVGSGVTLARRGLQAGTLRGLHAAADALCYALGDQLDLGLL